MEIRIKNRVQMPQYDLRHDLQGQHQCGLKDSRLIEKGEGCTVHLWFETDVEHSNEPVICKSFLVLANRNGVVNDANLFKFKLLGLGLGVDMEDSRFNNKRGGITSFDPQKYLSALMERGKEESASLRLELEPASYEFYKRNEEGETVAATREYTHFRVVQDNVSI
jgi:hypothetical protein